MTNYPALLALPASVSLLIGLATLCGTFFLKLHRARSLLRLRQRQGLSVAPGHSFLFGHLLYLKSYLDRFPTDAHLQYAFGEIGREHFHDTGGYYIDLWPMTGLTFIIISPEIGAQVTQTNPKLNCERPKLMPKFFGPITDGPTMFDVNEASWKPLRVIFSRGFHSERVNEQVPSVVQEVMTYADTLRGIAEKGEVVLLEPITLRFTIDMIGKTILNSSLGAQNGYNPLADGMLSQIRWWHNANNSLNPLTKLNFIRTFMQWKNGRQMNLYIGAELDKRYEEYKSDPTSATSVSVMDLVLRAYLTGPLKTASPPPKLDAEFRAFAIRQIRLFVFAGHDSTASAICYAFYLLSKYPEVLARLRREHDEVLGTDTAAAAEKISQDPRILNKLVYTLAVIKESMRLFPPAGASREGSSGVCINDDAGNACPTEDTILWILHPEMHRWEKYWVRGDEFLPERWLVEPGHELFPKAGTWRAFELGPRNCIAQAMVLVELRVVLACLVRSFDVRPVYEEVDKKGGVGSQMLVRGERVYQIEKGAAHPVGGFPCRVGLAER